MKKIIHEQYKDYPEHPYISAERDIEQWEAYPEKFPYKKVEKKQMIRVEEGLLPGDIVLLWRISLNTFTNESVYPDYFEYRYGINSEESLNFLLNEGYAQECTASETLSSLNMVVLKRILTKHHLETKGKKEEILKRILNSLDEKELAQNFTLRKFKTTELGDEILNKHQDIIKKHGPKM